MKRVIDRELQKELILPETTIVLYNRERYAGPSIVP
jgi:hypothetical protein